MKDLSKKDSALLKLGRELKDLETVQDKLEKKEEELRSERNTVMEKKALKMYFHCKRIWRSYLTGQTRRATLNTLLYKLSNTLRSFFAEPLLGEACKFLQIPKLSTHCKDDFSVSDTGDAKDKLRVLPNTRIFPSEPPLSLTEKSSFSCTHQA